MDGINFLRTSIHYGGHFIVPILVAFIFYRREWPKVALILVATILVDADHLLANPIFDANRCSIGFHFLHSYFAITLYMVLVFVKQTRIIALGLLLHMFFDFQDCFW